MFFIDMKTHSFIDHTSHAVMLKYACNSNQVNIYARVKRYTPATIWFTFIFYIKKNHIVAGVHLCMTHRRIYLPGYYCRRI